MVEAALKWLPYPERPTSPAPESPSFNALNSILDGAPVYISVDEDGFTNEICVSWNRQYTDKLYACLIDVIHDHGLDGWKNARWLVYDKVSTPSHFEFRPSLDYQTLTMFEVRKAPILCAAGVRTNTVANIKVGYGLTLPTFGFLVKSI